MVQGKFSPSFIRVLDDFITSTDTTFLDVTTFSIPTDTRLRIYFNIRLSFEVQGSLSGVKTWLLLPASFSSCFYWLKILNSVTGQYEYAQGLSTTAAGSAPIGNSGFYECTFEGLLLDSTGPGIIQPQFAQLVTDPTPVQLNPGQSILQYAYF